LGIATEPIDVALAGEADRDYVLRLIRDRIKPQQQLGTTDDCRFAPFCDDVSTSRETAFAKICSRLQGTAMAAQELGLSVGR
jgi:5-methyltetrahydropteroyltriglutamate--homocysteine methyltransferase